MEDREREEEPREEARLLPVEAAAHGGDGEATVSAPARADRKRPTWTTPSYDANQSRPESVARSDDRAFVR